MSFETLATYTAPVFIDCWFDVWARSLRHMAIVYPPKWRNPNTARFQRLHRHRLRPNGRPRYR